LQFVKCFGGLHRQKYCRSWRGPTPLLPLPSAHIVDSFAYMVGWGDFRREIIGQSWLTRCRYIGDVRSRDQSAPSERILRESNSSPLPHGDRCAVRSHAWSREDNAVATAQDAASRLIARAEETARQRRKNAAGFRGRFYECGRIQRTSCRQDWRAGAQRRRAKGSLLRAAEVDAAPSVGQESHHLRPA